MSVSEERAFLVVRNDKSYNHSNWQLEITVIRGSRTSIRVLSWWWGQREGGKEKRLEKLAVFSWVNSSIFYPDEAESSRG